MTETLFVIQCSCAIFSEDEIEILETYGNRLKRLADGSQIPASEAGRHFVEVTKGTRRAETVYEKTWLKYQWRLEWERNPANREAMRSPRKVHNDRDDWKRMRSSSWSEMARRSRGLDV